MDREALIELISASLDGELGPEEKAQLDAELAKSSEARELLESYSHQSEALAGSPLLKAPPELRNRTLQVLKPKIWRRRLLWAASILLVLGLGVYFAQPGEGGPNRLYVTAEGLSLTPPEQTVALLIDEPLTLSSPLLSGTPKDGELRFFVHADAGTFSEQELQLRLSLDQDGDGEYELITQAQLLKLDAQDGFELLEARLPLEGGFGSLQSGRAVLELSAPDGKPLKVEFRPQDSYLELPYHRLAAEA